MSESGINEYENVSGGWLGVKVKDDNRRTGFRGFAVAPRGRVMLSLEERKATANAPRDPDDNPFANGNLRLIAKDQETSQGRPIGDGEVQDPEPEPQAPPSEPDPTSAEVEEHNRKAAAARAVPSKEMPKGPEASQAPEAQAGQSGDAKAPEQVATPEAVAAAGKKPEGKRAATETVGTPDAQAK